MNNNFQFYQLKIPSDALKEFNWKFDTTFNKAKEDGFIVGVADNQLFRTVRDIRHKNINYDDINKLISKKKQLKSDGKAATKEYKNLQYEINKYLYVSDIVTVSIKHPAHYKYLYKNGFEILDKSFDIKPKKFVRLSCSAGQARKSTVIFCNSEIVEAIKLRLDNNRDFNKSIVPNKLNAYFGLYTSGTHLVTEPRFAVIPDYENNISFKANWVSETNWDIDDTVEQKTINLDCKRTDGMGIISPSLAKQWSEDIGLDYICPNFVIRQSYIKGLLTTFDFVKFCKEKNNENYLIKTIYKDSKGNNKFVDVREIDVILSEGQFKLWNFYNSQEDYINNCHKNKLYWGVSQYSKKEQDEDLTLNYQFIQTLNLDKEKVEKLCSKFVNWTKSVSYDDADSAICFLVGKNLTSAKLEEYLKTSNENWIKGLIVNHSLINDSYIKNKIYYYTKNKIKLGCLGEITVNGNFQFLITDPYAFMQHACNQKITGLLNENEYYSNYWNNKNVIKVDGMRSPMTYRSEHVILNLIKNKETEDWYKYINNGIIINWFGNDCVRFSGSDFDGDLLATTNNEIMINGVYKDELPVAYEVPKPEKIIPTYDDLCNADLFTFGSKIGQITNKGTTAYALLPIIESTYGKNSEEYNLIINRLKQGCVAQSKQIDKGKLGKAVKSIPDVWVNKQIIRDEDDEDTIKYKQLMNNCLLTKRPYFFRYKYSETNKEYSDYYNRNTIISKTKWNLSLDDLYKLKNKNDEQIEFIEKYKQYLPVIDSDSTMNYMCKYLENNLKEIKYNIKNTNFDYNIYKSDCDYTNNEYSNIINKYKQYKKSLKRTLDGIIFINDHDENQPLLLNEGFLDFIKATSMPINKILNIFIDYFYKAEPKLNKDFLWNEFGDLLYNNILENSKISNV